MRRIFFAVLLLSLVAEAKPRGPQLSKSMPARRPPRPSNAQGLSHPPPDPASAVLLSLTGEHTVEVLMDQCDDECHLLINGTEKGVSTPAEPAEWIDISSDIAKGHGSGRIVLQVVNNAQFWSYRFQLRVDDKVVWHDECGLSGSSGCEHDDQTQGVVRELELHF